MHRLNIMAKGNLDVRDTLHVQTLGGHVTWNGINAILRGRGPCVARVRHETFTRSDALLEADDTIPDILLKRNLPLGAHGVASQFSAALFKSDPDVFVLTIQADVNNALMRHKKDGFLFLPHHWRTWPETDQAWLRASFVSAGLLEPADSMANLRKIIERLRQRSAAPVLIYNVSSYVPGEQVHIHAGMDDLLSTRIKRFNLALIELSQETGVSIIDVDAALARRGAESLTYGTYHLNADGCRVVTEDVVRVLEELGCLDHEVRTK